MAEQQTPKGFWSTIPGVLTGLAGLVTAMTALLAFLWPRFWPEATTTGRSAASSAIVSSSPYIGSSAAAPTASPSVAMGQNAPGSLNTINNGPVSVVNNNSSTLPNVATIEATYHLCIASQPETCPPSALRLPCGTDLAQWARKECASFSLNALSQAAGGMCGTMVVEIKCVAPQQR